MTVTVEKIAPFSIGGAGAGNSYRYRVTYPTSSGSRVSVVAGNERDVAYSFRQFGLAVPAEFEGPYDGFGRKQEAA